MAGRYRRARQRTVRSAARRRQDDIQGSRIVMWFTGGRRVRSAAGRRQRGVHQLMKRIDAALRFEPPRRARQRRNSR